MIRTCVAIALLFAADNDYLSQSTTVGHFRGETIAIVLPGNEVLAPEALWWEVREVMISTELDHRGVTISQADVDRRVSQLALAGGLTKEISDRFIQELEALRQAVDIWHEEPLRDDEIYKTYLEPKGIDRGNWEAYKENAPTLKDMQRLRFPKSHEELLRGLEPSARFYLRNAVLAKLLSPDLLISEGEGSVSDESAEMVVDGEEMMDHVNGELADARSVIDAWMAYLILSGELQIETQFNEQLLLLARSIPGTNREADAHESSYSDDQNTTSDNDNSDTRENLVCQVILQDKESNRKESNSEIEHPDKEVVGQLVSNNSFESQGAVTDRSPWRQLWPIATTVAFFLSTIILLCAFKLFRGN